MIYYALNFIIAIFLLWLVFYFDKNSGKSETNSLLQEPIVFLTAYGLVMGFALFFAMRNNSRVSLISSQAAYTLLGAYSISLCFYLWQFPRANEQSTILSIAKWTIYVACGYICFTRITKFEVSEIMGLQIASPNFLTGRISFYLSFSWFDVYMFFVMMVFPILALIVMMLKTEKAGFPLDLQRSVLNVLAFIIGIVFQALMKKAYTRVPLFATLNIVPYALILVLMVRVALTNSLYDWRSALGALLGILLKLIAPSVLVGVGFISLWNVRNTIPSLFVCLNLIIIAIALTASYQLTKIFDKIKFFAREKYESDLERDLPTLNYDFEPDEVMEQMRSICMTDIGMRSMRILIDNGVDAWESSFDSEDDTPIKVSNKNQTIDSLMNMNRTILLRNLALTTKIYQVNKEELLKLFDETQSDAIVILNEGRHIIGMLLFGAKTTGNVYNEYDYDVFTKLYSYFFVFGYYMKNIANQSIVGTVNREIKMSAQLITSIQENVDLLRNPDIEAGYLMVPAHNIGGEFVDLIRLSEDKHIFVIGDLSGKGISASMSMVITKSIIRGFLNETKDFKLLVQKVNSFIRYNLPKGTFFEGLFALVDFSTNTMYYINCGVPALFLYTRSYNNVIEIQGEGRVLGFAKDISKLTKVKKIVLSPGDIVMACTDGLIDETSLRGEKFGKERIQKAITENSILAADKIARVTYNSMRDFITKEPEEDVSILTLRYKAK